jgi:hypothetical protein
MNWKKPETLAILVRVRNGEMAAAQAAERLGTTPGKIDHCARCVSKDGTALCDTVQTGAPIAPRKPRVKAEPLPPKDFLEQKLPVAVAEEIDKEFGAIQKEIDNQRTEDVE